MRKADRAWVADLLEGEGSFTTARTSKKGVEYVYPSINMWSTDEDVIRRLHGLTGVGNIYGPYVRASSIGKKPQWQWQCTKTADAVRLMKELRPLMCSRRSSRIDEVLRETARSK